MSQTIRIIAGEVNGIPYQESINVQKIAASRYRVLASPGYANGFAAGDVLDLIDESGHFRIIERSGNICVQIFFEGDKNVALREFERRFGPLGGTLDGGFDGDTGFLLIYTIPYSAGFKAIEDVFKDLPHQIGVEKWMYGNVYADDGALLNWWVKNDA